MVYSFHSTTLITERRTASTRGRKSASVERKIAEQYGHHCRKTRSLSRSSGPRALRWKSLECTLVDRDADRKNLARQDSSRALATPLNDNY